MSAVWSLAWTCCASLRDLRRLAWWLGASAGLADRGAPEGARTASSGWPRQQIAACCSMGRFLRSPAACLVAFLASTASWRYTLGAARRPTHTRRSHVAHPRSKAAVGSPGAARGCCPVGPVGDRCTYHGVSPAAPPYGLSSASREARGAVQAPAGSGFRQVSRLLRLRRSRKQVPSAALRRVAAVAQGAEPGAQLGGASAAR